MAKKMWDGRFSKETDETVNDFNSSISFDCRMYRQDIQGSIAHASMLASRGIISPSDGEKIVSGLLEIERELDVGTLRPDPEAEDIHMFIESRLTAMIGDAGKKLHTGRSRNDQVALDIRMYLREEIAAVREQLCGLCRTVLGTAERHVETIMPGYTHLQRAQPVTFAHHLMAYIQMFFRDLSRLGDCGRRMDAMPLGSGALAATTYPLDREAVAEHLRFSKPTDNSIDGVSDRDFVLELASDLAILMVHLSRFSEEIVLWSSAEFGFIELDDAFSTGSSIMPQKKNPDVAELTRGKSGRVFGDLVALLTVMKGLPLAYNKDMQEDKEAIFDSIDTVKACLPAFTGMIGTLTVRGDAMRRAAAGGYTNATDLADYLVRKGIPFRDSHELSGRIVAYAVAQGKALDELSIGEYRSIAPAVGEDVYDSIRLEQCVNGRGTWGGPAFATVRQSIENAYLELEKYSSRPG